MKKLFFSLTAGLVLTCHSVLAASLECPAFIKTKQSLEKKLNGWEEFVLSKESENRFNGISFYSGHPRELASLVPDNEHTKTNKLIWTFGKEQIWLECRYSDTDIKLIRKLPEGIKSCAVSYRSFDPVQIFSIRCA